MTTSPTTGSDTAKRSTPREGRDRFARLVWSEWTKLRTVRGWIIATAATTLAMVLFALLTGASSVQHGRPQVPIGPGGGPVTDSFYFVHQPLATNGSITVSVSALTDSISSDSQPGIVPWAKAGLIVKQSTRQGSPYAAIMITGSHGVRMQYDYVNDAPGLPGPVSATSARWLRLDRSGDAVTGYDSADGTHWTTVGTVHVAGLESTAQGGLFVASPGAVEGMGTVTSVATAVFGNLHIQGGRPGGGIWTGEQVGSESPSFSGYPRNTSGSFTDADGTFTVTGAGDIAPAVRATLPTGGVIGDLLLLGTFTALITVIVVGTRFVTAEYRHKLIRVTLTAGPGRTRVLAAKALVLGTVTFLAGLAGTLVAVPLGEKLARADGVYLFPVASSTQLRVEVGTAAMLATASVLALAVGAIIRRSAGAVATVTLAIVLPYMLVATAFMPTGVSDWLTRITPAAALAVQQTLAPDHQVASIYTPYDGYYPLVPWAGLAVLAGYAAVCLTAAAVLLHRRDARCGRPSDRSST